MLDPRELDLGFAAPLDLCAFDVRERGELRAFDERLELDDPRRLGVGERLADLRGADERLLVRAPAEDRRRRVCV